MSNNLVGNKRNIPIGLLSIRLNIFKYCRVSR